MNKTKILNQTESSTRWMIPLKVDETFLSVDGLFNENLEPLKVDYSLYKEGNSLIIDFGYDNHKGSVKYSYIQEDLYLEVSEVNLVKIDGELNEKISLLEKIKINDKGVEKTGYRPAEASITYIDNEIVIEFNKPFTGRIIKN